MKRKGENNQHRGEERRVIERVKGRGSESVERTEEWNGERR